MSLNVGDRLGTGEAPQDSWLAHKPKEAKLLDGMVAPDPVPAWLSDADLQIYVDAFGAGGFRGSVMPAGSGRGGARG